MAKKRYISIPEDGINYDNKGRLKYNPDFHPYQNRKLNHEERAYLCKFYEVDSLKSLSLALGRTEQKIDNQIKYLRKIRMIDYYKAMWDRMSKRYQDEGTIIDQ